MNDTNKWGIPYEDLFKVADSAIRAEAQSFKEAMADPMTTWPTVIPPVGFKFDPLLKSKMMDQMLDQRVSGRRWDGMKGNRQPVASNEWMRGVWIIKNWIQMDLRDENDGDIDEIGLSYFTDETAAEWIQSWFPAMDDFTTKQFENFRKKYALAKVPKAFLIKGVMHRNGRLKITSIGGKMV